MGGMIKTPKPKADPAAEQQRKIEEQRTREENERLASRAKEDVTAESKGLRGRSSLLGTGGELGFPSTLG